LNRLLQVSQNHCFLVSFQRIRLFPAIFNNLFLEMIPTIGSFCQATHQMQWHFAAQIAVLTVIFVPPLSLHRQSLKKAVTTVIVFLFVIFATTGNLELNFSFGQNK
jgi:hypothetical protein